MMGRGMVVSNMGMMASGMMGGRMMGPMSRMMGHGNGMMNDEDGSGRPNEQWRGTPER